MFKKKADAETEALKKALTTALEELPMLTADSDEFTTAVENIEKLHQMLSSDRKKFKVSPDTLLTVGANIAGIVMILGYERLHVVSSKALGFVLKTKI